MAIIGKSSNLGASSSSASNKTATQEKRKQRATRAEQAKKPRPFQRINLPPHPGRSGTAVPGVHRGASNNMAMATAAIPFPMAGVNGAAPLWSTAATLGAASRAAALTLSSMPAVATAGANGHAAAHFVIAPAPAPGLQPPPAGVASSNAAAALALPAASAAISVMAPLVLAQAGAGGQLVPLPLHFVGYHPPCRDGDSGLLPAPAVGIPLAAALNKIENGALGRMLSALMPRCHPPVWQHQSKTGPPPPWWPTGSEHWWKHELLEHLDDAPAAALMHAPVPVPFASSYSLRKAQRVAVLVAIVKHLAPNFANIAAVVRKFGELSVSETKLWHSALNNERAKFMRPVFVLLPQPQAGAGGSTDPGAAGSVVAVHSVANLPAGASVSEPADGGNGGEVIAAEGAELVDALLAGDGGDQQAVNFPAGDDGTRIHNQGAVVVAAPSGHVRPVAAELEMMMQQSEQHGGIQAGNVGVVAAAEDEQAHDNVGVVFAADAPAGDDGRDQPVNNFPAGAAVAAAPTTGHVHQVAGGPPEMTTMMQAEPDGGVPGDDVAAAAVNEDDEQVDPVVAPNQDAVAAVEEEAPEDDQWWYEYDTEVLNWMLAEYESFGDAILFQ